ncbi:MAG: HlyD family secretion protein, partial [Gammaproteobacteria bacterium]
AGVVVSGDLSQSLGAPVGRGDVLFEVAPLDSYRLILRVEENGIQDLEVGQRGQLRLSGLPGENLPFTVERITPVSETDNKTNFFRVEARLLETHALLRPGMEGVGKIGIGERKLIWVWTHRLLDWLHLWLWSWLP